MAEFDSDKLSCLPRKSSWPDEHVADRLTRIAVRLVIEVLRHHAPCLDIPLPLGDAAPLVVMLNRHPIRGARDNVDAPVPVELSAHYELELGFAVRDARNAKFNDGPDLKQWVAAINELQSECMNRPVNGNEVAYEAWLKSVTNAISVFATHVNQIADAYPAFVPAQYLEGVPGPINSPMTVQSPSMKKRKSRGRPLKSDKSRAEDMKLFKRWQDANKSKKITKRDFLRAINVRNSAGEFLSEDEALRALERGRKAAADAAKSKKK